MLESNVTLIPALSDNYIYLIADETEAVIIDPADAAPVLEALKGLKLTHILNTHHHSDHVGGNEALKETTGCKIFGPDDERVPALDKAVSESFTIGGLTFEVLFVPGHTTSHIAFFVPEKKWLFCGDVLFAGGCGRIFEGTPEEMLASLKKLTALPDDTLIFCGHEYTEKNLQFASMLEPDNIEIVTRLHCLKKPTIPSLLSIEKTTNPFLRCNDPLLKEALEMDNATELEVFTKIRKMKDNF